MRRALPTGTVTFLFTDVEGSTRLLAALGSECYAEALTEHRRIVRAVSEAHGGVEVDTQGDAFFIAFPTAPGAVAAAAEIVDRLVEGPITVRLGVHTGTPLLTEEGYVGEDVHRAARIAAAGHGGQVLLSEASASLVGGEPLLDLGEHRFKDLAAPERVFQLGDRVFPALRSLYRTNLPVPATPFLGRERELTEVVAQLDDPQARVVTLTGPGGTGKTRLGVQAAAVAAPGFPGGVWWVPLAPLDDDALVRPALARTLGLAEQPGRSLSETLVDALSARQALLLLDNCEHVLDGVADTVAPIVAACPRVTVLSTSRAPLELTGERVLAIPPLRRDESIALFTARAADVAPAPEESERDVIGELCERLDDLPLAIELAAARAAALTPAALLERLGRRLDLLTGPRDADARQRTLRATIRWSYDLLESDEQRLFRHLAVFAGGWSIEACEAVCDADLEPLLSLLANSLVRRRDDRGGTPRYWMLETIRQFAREALDEAGELEPLRVRHCAHATALASAALSHVQLEETSWVVRLEPDLENLRAALAFALEDPATRGEDIAALAATLAALEYLRGQYEASERLGAIASTWATDPIDGALARSMRARALLWRDRAIESWEEHLAAEAALGAPAAEEDAPWWRAWLLVVLAQAGYLYWHARTDELELALARIEQPLRRYGTPQLRSDAAHMQVTVRYRRERYVPSETTERLARDAYDLSVEAGSRGSEFHLGFALLWRGKLDESEGHLRRGFDDAHETGDHRLAIQSLTYLGLLLRKREDVEGVAETLDELASFDSRPGYEGLFHANRAWVAWRRGDRGTAEREALEAIGHWTTPDRWYGPVVFQWTARFPLLGVAVAAGDLGTSLAQADAMLDLLVQPLPAPLATALEDARRVGSIRLYDAVVDSARRGGYA